MSVGPRWLTQSLILEYLLMSMGPIVHDPEPSKVNSTSPLSNTLVVPAGLTVMLLVGSILTVGVLATLTSSVLVMSTVPVTVPVMGKGSEGVLTTWTLSGGGIGEGVAAAFCAWADAEANRVTSR